MLKLCEAAGHGGEVARDGAEADVDEDHSGSGAVKTECGGGAFVGAGDGGDAGKGPVGEVLASDDGEARPRVVGVLKHWKALGLMVLERIWPWVR